MGKFIIGFIILNMFLACAPPSKIENTVIADPASETETESLKISADYGFGLETGSTQKIFSLYDMSDFPNEVSIQEGSFVHENVDFRGSFERSGLVLTYTLNEEYIDGLKNLGKSFDSFEDKFTLVLKKGEKNYLFEVNLDISVIVFNDDGGVDTPASISARELSLAKSYLSRPSYVDVRSLIEANTQCGEIRFTEQSCDNCSTNNAFPIIEITPESVGSWSLSYTAICSDTVTNVSSMISGSATDEEPEINIVVKDKVMDASSMGAIHRLDLRELVVSITSDCSQENKSEVQFELGTCAMCEVGGDAPNITITSDATATDWSLEVFGVCKDGVTKDQALISGSSSGEETSLEAEDLTLEETFVNKGVEISLTDLVETTGDCGDIKYESISPECIGCEKSGDFPNITITPKIEGEWIYRFKASCENDENISDMAFVVGENTKASSFLRSKVIENTIEDRVVTLDLSDLASLEDETNMFCAYVVEEQGRQNVSIKVLDDPINRSMIEVTPGVSNWEFNYHVVCTDFETSKTIGPAKISGIASAWEGLEEVMISNISDNLINGVTYIGTERLEGSVHKMIFDLKQNLFTKSVIRSISTQELGSNDHLYLPSENACYLIGDRIRCEIESIDNGARELHNYKFMIVLNTQSVIINFAAQAPFIEEEGDDNAEEGLTINEGEDVFGKIESSRIAKEITINVFGSTFTNWKLQISLEINLSELGIETSDEVESFIATVGILEIKESPQHPQTCEVVGVFLRCLHSQTLSIANTEEDALKQLYSFDLDINFESGRKRKIQYKGKLK